MQAFINTVHQTQETCIKAPKHVLDGRGWWLGKFLSEGKLMLLSEAGTA